MMNIVPFRRNISLVPRSVDRFFDDPFFRFFDEAAEARIAWNPAVEVIESENEILFSAEVPGLPKEAINIDVNNYVLTISGERSEEKEENHDYLRRERVYGKFSRSFRLPKTADVEKVSASLKDGVLEVKVPKKEEAKPKQVKIKVA
jgi:HSP20 family protein